MTPTSSLAQALAGVRQRVARVGSKKLNEENTKATLIEPILRALGWDTEDVDEVAREYRLKSHHTPVDYGLLALRTPRLFVEAKALRANLNDHKWTSQIMTYAGVAGVEWIVLTDGDEYRIYNSHAPVTVEEKLFRTVRITDSSALLEETLDLLSKARLEENRLGVLWRAHFVDRQVKAAIEDLIGGDNDMLLVNHVLGRIKTLSTDEVRASILRCKVHLDFPISPEDILAPSRKKKSGKTKGGSIASYDASLSQLIEAGLLPTPLKLFSRYKGTDLVAKLLRKGTVECLGKSYTSLSLAGAAALSSAGATRPDGSFRACNGWTFWKYKATDGQIRKVDHARQAYLRTRSVSGASTGGATTGVG